MLIDYSERAYTLLHRPLTASERDDLYSVFCRIGEGLGVRELPETYADWQVDRRRHLVRDLSYSPHTALLFQQYRRHLGVWRYNLLLQVQAVLVPDEVRRLLRLSPNKLMLRLVQTYGLISPLNIQTVVHTLLVPPRYWAELRGFERAAA